MAIGGGALIGGILLDGFGLAVLPVVTVVIMAAGVVYLIVSDVWLRRRDARYLRTRSG